VTPKGHVVKSKKPVEGGGRGHLLGKVFLHSFGGEGGKGRPARNWGGKPENEGSKKPSPFMGSGRVSHFAVYAQTQRKGHQGGK